MDRRLLGSVSPLLPTLVTAVAALTMWAAWLGWDQRYDVHPDGSSTGPYEAWQVLCLVLTLLTLLIPVVWAASRHHITGAVVGTTAGLTVASFYDWSDDASGLYGVGVTMVMLGTAAVTTGLSFLIAAIGRRPQPAAPVTA